MQKGKLWGINRPLMSAKCATYDNKYKTYDTKSYTYEAQKAIFHEGLWMFVLLKTVLICLNYRYLRFDMKVEGINGIFFWLYKFALRIFV